MKNGIDIDLLPTNIQSAAYVTPSNQFPTGTVMPIGERYKLLDWAMKNNSFVIEDDYDSELRYFGKPIPALKGLDDGNHVVYLGSFSSTLFRCCLNASFLSFRSAFSVRYAIEDRKSVV